MNWIKCEDLLILQRWHLYYIYPSLKKVVCMFFILISISWKQWCRNNFHVLLAISLHYLWNLLAFFFNKNCYKQFFQCSHTLLNKFLKSISSLKAIRNNLFLTRYLYFYWLVICEILAGSEWKLFLLPIVSFFVFLTFSFNVKHILTHSVPVAQW